ncbi:hypothetical protein K438DRAFT_2055400 [Mycena galopus ATCC 62051]|nr:hypothetical protein K438DRAFT_2055400 [Mycena galopus ATCC 62051]
MGEKVHQALCYQFWAVFVTGNANKLKEVKAILSAGGRPIEIESHSLDSNSRSSRHHTRSGQSQMSPGRRTARRPLHNGRYSALF